MGKLGERMDDQILSAWISEPLREFACAPEVHVDLPEHEYPGVTGQSFWPRIDANRAV